MIFSFLKFHASLFTFLLLLPGLSPGSPEKKKIRFDRYLALQIKTIHGKSSKINWLVIHHNEFHAARVMRWAHKRYGGKTIEVINRSRPRQRALRSRARGRHFLYDPNRIFSKRGVARTLHHYNLYLLKRHRKRRRVASRYLKRVKNFLLKHISLSNKKCLIALHNNMNRGRVSIKRFQKKKDYRVFRSKVMHPKNFVVVTQKAHFEYLQRKKVNVAWHYQLSKKSDDGSLSTYSLKNNFCYMNIESRFGDIKKHKKIIMILMEMLNIAILP